MNSAIPSRHQLDAAIRVASVLTTEERNLRSVRAGYEHLPSDGIFGTSDLIEGESLLIAAGLARLKQDKLSLAHDVGVLGSHDLLAARELVLTQLLLNQVPTWLPIATATGGLRPELIPTEAEEQLADIVVDPNRREALLLNLGQKYEADALSILGAVGEKAVLEECIRTLVDSDTPHLADQVARVSLVSDALGYDITSPTVNGDIRRLEVKTMGASRTVIRVFISRNEYDTGLADEDWRLVVCRLTSEESAEILGWCEVNELRSLVPKDSGPGVWRQARLQFDSEILTPGLPLGEGS